MLFDLWNSMARSFQVKVHETNGEKSHHREPLTLLRRALTSMCALATLASPWGRHRPVATSGAAAKSPHVQTLLIVL